MKTKEVRVPSFQTKVLVVSNKTFTTPRHKTRLSTRRRAPRSIAFLSVSLSVLGGQHGAERSRERPSVRHDLQRQRRARDASECAEVRPVAVRV